MLPFRSLRHGTNVRQVYVRPRYAGPTTSGGGWNDLCLLLNPGMGSGANKMTPARTRSQFSLYCVMGANLIMTGNLSTIDSDTLATWGNEVITSACNVFARRAAFTRGAVLQAAIAINQDPLGLPHRVLSTTTAPVASLPAASDPRAVTVSECGGEPARQLWSWGANGTVVNRGACMNVKQCLTDVIIDECVSGLHACGGATPSEPAANEAWTLQSDGLIQVTMDKHAKCLAAASDGSLSVAACDAKSEQQRWSYDRSEGHVKRLSDGSCLTAPATNPAPGPPPDDLEQLIVGRPLQHGRWAIAFLNNHNDSRTLTCGAACFKAMGLASPPIGAALDDVFGGKLGTISASDPSIKVEVGAEGGSRLVTMSPPAPAVALKADDKAVSAPPLQNSLINLFPRGALDVECYFGPLLFAIPHTQTLIAMTEARLFSCNDGGPKRIALRRSEDNGPSARSRFDRGTVAIG